jgi:hydrogenase maturation factor HypF (carbamoyltransferase family)
LLTNDIAEILEGIENLREIVKDLSNQYYYKNQKPKANTTELNQELTSKLDSVVSTFFGDIFDTIEESLDTCKLELVDKSFGAAYSSDFEPLLRLDDNDNSVSLTIGNANSDMVSDYPEEWDIDIDDDNETIFIRTSVDNVNDVLLAMKSLIEFIEKLVTED